MTFSDPDGLALDEVRNGSMTASKAASYWAGVTMNSPCKRSRGWSPQRCDASGSEPTDYDTGGDDTLYGGDGDDIMGGGNGADYLYGEAGNDTNYGETLLGSLLYLFDNGNDHIYSGPGNDDLDGQKRQRHRVRCRQ